jgi:hypothetical protein
MVFEDAHWIDPTSREVLDLTVERVRTLPVLLIVTFRPEFPDSLDRPAARQHVVAYSFEPAPPDRFDSADRQRQGAPR